MRHGISMSRTWCAGCKNHLQYYFFTKEFLQILNETKGGIPQGDGGYRTMSFGQADMGSIVGRTAVAEKMGYGDFAGGAQKTGLGVQTGIAELDKALNRDYSELVKRFNKK